MLLNVNETFAERSPAGLRSHMTWRKFRPRIFDRLSFRLIRRWFC